MNQKGSATILTLLVSAVILTVAIGFNWIVKEHLKAAEGLKTKTEAMMAARSTFDGLIFYVLTGELTQKAILISREQNLLGIKQIPLGGTGIKLEHGISVKVQDSSSLISLVSSNVEVLKRLAAVAGGKSASVNVLVDSFLDWTDPDDLSRANGAESFYYRAEGKPYRPRNFPIQYKDELAWIKGMDAELYAKMAPHLTMLPSLGFNPNTADDEILMAFLDIDKKGLEKVRSFLEQKTISTDGEVFSLTGKILPHDDLDIYYFPSPFFEITVAVGSPRAVYRLNVGLDIRPALTAPFGVVYWREG